MMSYYKKKNESSSSSSELSIQPYELDHHPSRYNSTYIEYDKHYGGWTNDANDTESHSNDTIAFCKFYAGAAVDGLRFRQKVIPVLSSNGISDPEHTFSFSRDPIRYRNAQMTKQINSDRCLSWTLEKLEKMGESSSDSDEETITEDINMKHNCNNQEDTHTKELLNQEETTPLEEVNGDTHSHCAHAAQPDPDSAYSSNPDWRNMNLVSLLQRVATTNGVIGNALAAISRALAYGNRTTTTSDTGLLTREAIAKNAMSMNENFRRRRDDHRGHLSPFPMQTEINLSPVIPLSEGLEEDFPSWLHTADYSLKLDSKNGYGTKTQELFFDAERQATLQETIWQAVKKRKLEEGYSATSSSSSSSSSSNNTAAATRTNEGGGEQSESQTESNKLKISNDHSDLIRKPTEYEEQLRNWPFELMKDIQVLKVRVVSRW